MDTSIETRGGCGAALEGVTVRFDGVLALDDVSLTLAPGEKAVLIGPAAAGKTVLLKCLAGILRPDAGRVSVDGAPVGRPGSAAHERQMARTGVLFQQGGLLDSLPVWRNVAFRALTQGGLSAGKAKAQVVDRLAQVNLPPRVADLMPAELSGGMYKRVGLARAMMGSPGLLLLDAPTAGLDPITTNAIDRLIEATRRELGASVLAVTSDMASARAHYDTIHVLVAGRLAWSGSREEAEASDEPHLRQLLEGRKDGPIAVPGRSAA